MASFETLLIKVRSETPTSFFFVVSNVAFLMFGLPVPDAPLRPPDGALFAAFSPFGRRLIAYIKQVVSDSASTMWHLQLSFPHHLELLISKDEPVCFRLRRDTNGVAGGFP